MRRNRFPPGSRPSCVRNILLDAGALIALFACDDKHHRHFDDLVTALSDDGLRLSTTCPCVVEASYLLEPPQRFENFFTIL